jgi:hypothetical protein
VNSWIERLITVTRGRVLQLYILSILHMATQPSQASQGQAQPPTLPSNLGGPPPDIASLESIKFRVTQLIDSIQTLAWQLEAFHPPPPWPDLLAKYAVGLRTVPVQYGPDGPVLRARTRCR